MNKKKNESRVVIEGIKSGLKDAITHAQGKLHLRSELISVPTPPVLYKPKQIRIIRENSNYSQGLFAKVLNVSVKTVQSWESGDRTPSSTALRLLEIIEKGIYCPEIFKRN
ncbi:MAG: helix-turn-helix domain-containing protein [Silvanigrellaceae bacterium]|nr:helix-turn-helix domain-containing protein [Silvanigrellaceae bacterium]